MEEIKNELLIYIPKLTNAIRDMSQLFQTDRAEKGMELLFEIIDGIDWVSTACTGLSDQISEYIVTLNGFLGEINENLAIRNYVMIADIFEYEVIGILNNIYKITSAKSFH
jgi:hypothetical protein